MTKMKEEYTETGLEIAVIGMVGRFPGAADIEEFWENLKNGVESISFFSDEELGETGIAPEVLRKPGYVRAQPVLGDIEYFDSSFFGYTPKEAQVMDPQVRVFHEYAWKALEDAGYDPYSYKEPIGCYSGASGNIFWEALSYLTTSRDGGGAFDAKLLLDKDYLSTRVAHKLNLRGPAVAVHTACSTSLVAIHMACQGLIGGECALALAGGVSVSHLKKEGYMYQEGMIHSPDGHCRAFDARGNGTVFGDGIGIVVLKRLEDAVKDNDHIYAVIKGSYVNNDGIRRSAYTAPDIEGQAAVIGMAHRIAEVDPGSITYVETHGTGTSLGDPIEVEGLKLAFNTGKKHFCRIGSVKSNVGHLNIAAGVTGFIKTVLALVHKLIPPSLYYEKPNPKIDFENSPFYVNTTLSEWNRNEYPLRAGVSSFGIGGTNAHVVLEEAPVPANVDLTGDREYKLLLISAGSGWSLDRAAENLAEYLKKNPGVNLADAAYTLQAGRRDFEHRRMLVCTDVEEAVEALSSTGSRKVRSFYARENDPPVVFMFAGLGAQYVNMGLDLYRKEPVFREEMDRCFNILKPIVGSDIKEVLYPTHPVSDEASHPGGDLLSFEIAQVVIFIFEYALARLLMKWGIEPRAMIGYSFGEYAAACLAGVFSLEDALKLIAARGKLIGELPEGLMVSVPLPAAETKPFLNDELSISIDNGPSCIVSGPPGAVESFEKEMKEKRYMCMRLEQASRAIHSGMMEPILGKFEEIVREIPLNKPRIPFISNVTGKWAAAGEITEPAYWSTHLSQTVQFAAGIKELVKEPHAIFVEIGPGRDLSTLVQRYTEDNPTLQVLNLVRPPQKEISDGYFLLKQIGCLWLYGQEINWDKFYNGDKRRRLSLPSYAFERQRFWLEGDPFKMGEEMFKMSPGGKKQDISEWFYFPSWKPSLLPGPQYEEMSRRTAWLVFMDECGLGVQLVNRLEEEGLDVITVRKGTGYEKKNDRAYTVNPGQSGDYKTLFRELNSHHILPGRILHLWSFITDDPQAPGKKVSRLDWMEKCQDLGYYSLIFLTHALENQGPENEYQITVVTNNLQRVYGDELLHPERATLFAPVNIIPREYRSIKCRAVDISSPAAGDRLEKNVLRQLLQELKADSPEGLVVYRGGSRLVPGYEPVKLASDRTEGTPLRLREKGVYLVTGGLGAIGLLQAKYLAGAVGARLVLIGRSVFPPQQQWDQWLLDHQDREEDTAALKIKKLQEIEKLGGEVLVFSADVSHREQMAEVVRQAEKQLGPINGVIHNALQIDGGVIHLITREKTENVFASKIKGALVLDDLLKDHPLDFFVLSSSTGSIMMEVGHVAYAGASAFLDAFAQHKASVDNGVVMSINWGAWQDVGGALELARKHARALGLSESRAKIENGILSTEGIEAFSRIMQLQSSMPQVVVYPQDLIEALNRSKTLSIRDKGEKKQAPGQKVQRPQLESEYVPAGSDIEKTLVETWGEFFGFDRIGIRDDFFELGGDSLKAITMVNKIRENLDVEIGLNDLFLSPTIEKLAGQISAQLTGSIPQPGRQGRTVKYPSAVRDLENIRQPFPLTHIQAAYLLGRTDQFDMGSISTHLYLEVATQFDARRLNRSLNRTIARHPMMRTIVTEEGEQKILEEIPGYEIKVEDLRHLHAGEQQKRILSERERMSQQVFDLGRWPLFEIKGMQLSHEDLYIFVDFDMFIGDGYSFQIIIGEWALFYSDPGSEPEPLEFTFRDYVLASRELRNSDIYAADREYWLNKLEDFPSAPGLPIICQPSEIKEPSFKKIQKFYSEEEWEILRGIAQKNNITPSVLLCTAFAQVLAYWSNQRKFALNLPLFNRFPFHKDVDKIVGNFTSVLLLEVDWEPGSTIIEAAVKIRETLMEAMEHRHYDGVEFMREISRYKNLFTRAVMPVVFNSTIVEGNRPDPDDNSGGKGLDVKMRYARTSQVYLEGHAALRGNKLEVNWGYVEELFGPDVIEIMFDQYTRIINALIKGDTDCKPQLPERDLRLWENYNKTEGDIPASLLHRMFTRQAALTPGNIALEYGEDRLTYRQLDERSNRVARYLKEQGVGRNHKVAVITTRSFETMINVMGVMKAGAAYVPIDPDYPEERQKYIFENSDCQLLLEPGLYRVENLEHYPAGEVKNINKPGDLAYVIYTSGSTGQPKGVMITHRQAANTIVDINRKFNVTGTDRVMGISSMCFDLSVYDVFGSFSTGASLVLIPTQKDVDILIETLEGKKITFWNSVPAILDMVVKNLEENYVNDYLTRALLSGDWIPLTLPGKVKKHFPNCDVISLGGATEGSVWSIYYPVKEVRKKWKSIPYGYPLTNQTFYVLNFQRELCPVGVPGELYIGGDGVAEGYMSDEEKTGNSFLVHSVFGRIYKTGDYGVFHREGYIEFLGRKDHQVKIRGYRVELGEIETCLLEHRQVKSTVVVDRTNASGSRYLCAYIVPDSGMNMDMETAAPQFKEFLSQKLPDYMIPSFFIPLESIPLTPNGKVNRKALPEPQEEIAEATYEAPANKIEETLVELWQEILEEERVGVYDNFFELGGDSLRAATFVSRVRKALQVKIPLAEVFRLQRLREIAGYIKGKGLERYIPIEYSEKKEFYELSSAQKRLYVLHRLYPDSTGYNIFQAFNLEGEVDWRKLEATFRLLISRHEVLRTFIKIVGDIPVQEVLDDVAFAIRVYEVEEAGVQGILTGFIRPFDLSQAPLMRVGLIRIPPVSSGAPGSRHILLVDIHHIITDAVSLTLFMRDFIAAYSGEELPPITFQYKDYAEWQNRKRESGALKKQEDYWLREFVGEIPLLHMPTDYPRPRAAAFDAAIVAFTIDGKETEMIKSLAVREEATVFIVLLAVYTLWLAKLSGQEDIIVGVPIAGRWHPALEKIMGMFINTLAMRNYPFSEMIFAEFLGEVKQRSLDAFENQDYQFEDLVNKLTLTKDPGRSPVFDAMFDFLNVDTARESSPSGKLTPYKYRKYTANFDLRLMGVEEGGQLVFSLKYKTALFKKETMERFVEYLKNIISAVLKDSRKKLADMEIISGEERKRILYEFNNTCTEFPGGKRIHQHFEQWAAKHPDKIALAGPAQGTIQLTYKGLNKRAGHLAGYLRHIGIREDRTAAILLDRSPWMVESILATWKAGGAYIPLDTDYPVRRILEIMNDSGAEILITRSEYVDPAFAKEYRGIIIEVNKEKPAGAHYSGFESPGPEIGMNNLAYVIYTSGSTGRPKGAMVEHKGMMNHIWAKIHDLHLTAQSIVAQNASQTFDISVWQLFSALAVGGRTVIYPDDVISDPEYIINRLIRGRVTILEVVPSYLAVLLDEVGQQETPPLPLHYLLVTGEEVKPALVKRWFDHYPGIEMVNAYGPTEASDDITHHIMGSAPGGERIPIGKTLHNLGIYIVDKNMKLCPVGVKGEICVSGIGVGRGYLNDANRTADVFREDPFAGQEGGRLYKTGDLGRWLPDGTIEFFGRKDYQVKVRGFRIELGEIESKLAAYPQARDAVVVDKEDERGNKYLCAYMVMESGAAFNIVDIKKWLLERFPDYMVPGHFVQLDQMPLTPNGKIDRKALPEPELSGNSLMGYISEEMLRRAKEKEIRKDKQPPAFSVEEPGRFLDSTVVRMEKEKSLLEEYSRKTGKNYYLLSYPQKMIYFIEKKHSGTGCNNIVFFIRYPEAIDSNLLEEAVNKVIFKHQALRLRMAEVEYESGIIPAQYPTPYRKVTIDRLDFSVHEDSEIRLQTWLKKKGAEAFDFWGSDLFYFAYVKIQERESGCYMKIHNIVSDGLTFHILIKEINRIYRDLKAGKTVHIKEAPPYLDFIPDELAYFKSERAKNDMKFYLDDMLPPPGEVTLSSRVIGSDSANIDADCIILGIPADLRRKIHEYLERTKSSLYKIMLSALSIYIFRALGRDDVVIGSLVNNRSHFKYIKTAGIFIHFLPLRIRIDGNMDFNRFVDKTGRYLDDIIANRQGYPFEILAGQLRENFGIDPGYFYNINLIGYPDLENVTMERPFAGFEEAPFSLYVNRYNRDIHGILEFEWIFRRGLFLEEEIRRIHRCLENILNDALDNPGKNLAEIEFLSPGEKEQRLSGRPARGDIRFPGGSDEHEELWVKGIRVNAGEIENALLGYKGVKEAAVVTAAADEYGNMNRPLCGFIVSENSLNPADVKEYLSLKLPPYMIPSYFFQVEKMPVTGDGKVDRKVLAAVDIEIGRGKEYEGPRDRLEKELRKLWAGVLGIDEGDIGVNTNFFDLGGHSLTAIMLTAKIHRAFNVKLTLAQVFSTPTVRGLARFLKTAVKSEFASIEVVEKREYYALSSAQKRLYILQRMDSENIGYNLPFIVMLQVDLDIERFEDSLKKLISRHDGLRTSFGVIDGEPVQRIHTEVDFEIEHNDFIHGGNGRGCEGAGQSKKAVDDVFKNFVRPFNLAKPPLLRVGLIQIERGKYIFMKDMHHIISDDISMGIFTRETMAFYAGEEVPQLKLQYKDYSQWQNHSLNSVSMKEQEAYWLKQFEEKIPQSDLPCDYERGQAVGYEGDILGGEIGTFATGRLREIAGGKGATLNMLLLTIFAVLLSKYTDQEDIVIGIPASGRIHHDLGHIIGNFVNMLALRIYPNYRKRFIDLLEEVRECTIKAFDNQAYQFDTFIEKLKLKRSLNRHPLFDTVFQFTSAVDPGMREEQPEMGIENPAIKPYQNEDNSVASRFDLSLNAVELKDKISYKLRYRSQLFKRSTIEQMSLAYEEIVGQVINKPGVELFNIEIINDYEIKEKETVDLDAGSVRFNF